MFVFGLSDSKCYTCSYFKLTDDTYLFLDLQRVSKCHTLLLFKLTYDAYYWLFSLWVTCFAVCQACWQYFSWPFRRWVVVYPSTAFYICWMILTDHTHFCLLACMCMFSFQTWGCDMSIFPSQVVSALSKFTWASISPLNKTEYIMSCSTIQKVRYLTLWSLCL